MQGSFVYIQKIFICLLRLRTKNSTDITTGETFQTKPFPEFIAKIIADGGLIEAIKKGDLA